MIKIDINERQEIACQIQELYSFGFRNPEIREHLNLSINVFKRIRRDYNLKRNRIQRKTDIHFCTDCKKAIKGKKEGRCFECKNIKVSDTMVKKELGFCDKKTQDKIKRIFINRTGQNNPGKYKKNHFISKIQKDVGACLCPLGFESEKYIDSYRVDFINKENKIVVEIYGDYWHCNPLKYTENFYNKNKKMYAKDIWEYDNRREDFIKDQGYRFFKFFQSDLHSFRNASNLSLSSVFSSIKT